MPWRQKSCSLTSRETAREIDLWLIRPPSNPASFCVALIGLAIKHKRIAPRNERTTERTNDLLVLPPSRPTRGLTNRQTSEINRRSSWSRGKNSSPATTTRHRSLWRTAVLDRLIRTRIARFGVRVSSCAPCPLWLPGRIACYTALWCVPQTPHQFSRLSPLTFNVNSDLSNFSGLANVPEVCRK